VRVCVCVCVCVCVSLLGRWAKVSHDRIRACVQVGSLRGRVCALEEALHVERGKAEEMEREARAAGEVCVCVSVCVWVGVCV
jgi:hypothetical protein